MMTTTIRRRDLFRKATKDDRCKVCGQPVVCYDFGGEDSHPPGLVIVNPSVCHVNLGNEIASFWCPRMVS
jgi:hypothetical protein